MARTIHFISGLPRSGSTLLAALLQQNPRFRAGMSSPLAVLCERVLPVMGQGEYAASFDDGARLRVLRALFDAVLPAPPDPDPGPGAVTFDTNRAWCAHLRILSRLEPRARVVACVRDPVWILDSFERVFRAEPFRVSRLHKLPASATVFERAEQLMATTGAFGAAWAALQDAYWGEHAHRLVLLDYDALVFEPQRSLDRLHRALELPPFRYDPAAVALRPAAAAAAAAFDAAVETPGLHHVRPVVSPPHRRCVLPPALLQRLANTAFWRDAPDRPAANPGGATIIAPDPPG
ncbi:MAG: sulfotransferase [Gluconacetobacter diazotrophicus]|nr:sulfotransferase [Gluconacetobacter diazotrophicus]